MAQHCDLEGQDNKFINGVKAEIGFLLDASGASSSAIETMAGAGLTIEKLIVLNVDDFHNIHEYRRSDTTTTHDVSHFITILLKALPEIPSIPFHNPNQEKSIHNEEGIDAKIILQNAHSSFFPHLWLSYTGRKQAFTDLTSVSETHNERVERLLIYSYDDRIEQRKTDRSMQNTKLVDLKEGPLHSTDDYVQALRHMMNVHEVRTYLETQVLVAPMDYPGQRNVRRAINHRINAGDLSGIPEQILHIVPMIGPLRVSLNSRFGKKPKAYKIDLLLELASQGWSRVHTVVKQKFEQSKDAEARYLINLLDNVIPLVLDFYPVIFRNGNWTAYKEAMFRVWAIFYQYNRKHYNKFSPRIYFHSSLRRRIQKSNTVEQIIRQARIIDQMRGSNFFTDVFSENHNIRYSVKQLEYLEKRAALFLLNLFTGVYQNLSRPKVISSNVHSKFKVCELPTLGIIRMRKPMPILCCISREKNCRIFQQTVSPFNEMLTDENTAELAVEADENTGNEDFLLDDNIDLLFVRALNTLTNV
ncbi:8189_t:CDS:2 [Paraglomus occultum]|uniref:8189_t:CDS:1 n=1 Tax=Paraglomus occultum TaxID=144539 RepID=A0A9N9G4G7_9GLOM|nr:8189_t:CDS:2 [Paraglomus occultum]